MSSPLRRSQRLRQSPQAQPTVPPVSFAPHPSFLPTAAPPAPPPPKRRTGQWLESDLINRVRILPNALFLPSSIAKEERNDDEFSDDESEDDSLSGRISRSHHESAATRSIPPPAYVLRPKRPVVHTNYAYIYSYNLQHQQEAAELQEALVPIKLELELDGYKLTDQFLWNLRETLVPPEKFAEIMCADLGLPEKFITTIAISIKTQLDEHIEAGIDIPESSADSDETFLIDIDLLIGRVLVKDRFEWDCTSDVTPEMFAKRTCADLGLVGEAVPLYALSIRDQLLRQVRDRYSGQRLSRTGGYYIRESPGLIRYARDMDEWTPTVEVLDLAELERLAVADQRESRRARRETSRAAQAAKIKSTEVAATLASIRQFEAEMRAQFDSILPQQAPPAPLQRPNPPLVGHTQPVFMRTSLPQSITNSESPALSRAKTSGPQAPRYASELPPPMSNRNMKNMSRKELEEWHCLHCGLDGTRTLSIRRGPAGPRTLCNACGLRFSSSSALPPARKDRYKALYGLPVSPS